MSCTASATWNHPVSSPCYTEHGQHCDAVLSGCITTVAISRSGQLGLRCSVEPNCSGLSARLAGALVTRDRVLNTCEPSCVPGAARPFIIPVVHSLLGAVEYVAAPEPTSVGRRGSELRNTWQRRSSPLGEAESRAMGHVTASEPTSTGRRGPKLRNVWRRRSSTQQGDEARGHGSHDSTGPHLRPQDTWRLRSPPLQEGVVRSYSLRGSAWMHALLLVLT
jgi:hypothetical protein